jgi:uncharacterized protein (TIGR01370 family)
VFKKVKFLAIIIATVICLLAIACLTLSCVPVKSLQYKQVGMISEKGAEEKGMEGNNPDENDCPEKDNHMEPNSHKLFDADAKFICVLQNICFLKLEDEEFDIAIVDPDDCGLTKEQLEILYKDNKILLAYLSIGEAEIYRDYWQEGWEVGCPAFLDEENPDWAGNYKVKYWDNEWQEIVFGRLDQIMERGYDGVYLDIIDACKYYEGECADFAEEEMIDFVINISKRAKAKDNNFLVVPQNAEELVDKEDYLQAIDGIGRENLWYVDNNLQDEDGLNYALNYLKKVIEADKFVLAISYTTENDKKCSFIEMAKAHGFTPYVGRKELDTIENAVCD